MQAGCDMCGRSDATYVVKVAGARMVACSRCAAHGEIIEELKDKPKVSEIKREEKQKHQTVEKVEKVEEVIENIGEIVHSKREEMGLKQEDLAKKINEHESMIKRVEHGYIPDLKVAHKLQSFLHVKLTDLATQSDQEYVSNKGGADLTLGDIMIVKKKPPK